MVIKLTKGRIIRNYLSDYGRRYYLRELAGLLKRPHQSIKPHLEQLVKENILIKNKRRNVTDYSLNMGEAKIYEYLTLAEKEQLLERLSEDILLKLLFDKLSKYFNKVTFVIFGSFAKGIKANDIDMLAMGKYNVSSEIKDFEAVYDKKIHLIQISQTKKLKSAFIKEMYKMHLILNNTEKIVRWFGELYEQNKLV